MGKFYHRPPGGESWADVILRLRSVLNTINLHYADHRVLVVCHQVVVLCMRYILDELSEGQILAIDKQAEILNCGICAYDFMFDENGALLAKAGPVECRRADGSGRDAADRRARCDGRIEMSRMQAARSRVSRASSAASGGRGRQK